MMKNLELRLPGGLGRVGKLPLFLMVVFLASLPYIFYLNRSAPTENSDTIVAFDDISELMQLEFRFQKLFDAVNEYRLSPNDGLRQDIQFHQEILKIHTSDDISLRLAQGDITGSGSLTVINSAPQMLALISSEIDLYLTTNDPATGRRLAEKLQAFLFEFHSELMYLSDMTNQAARRQEIAHASSLQRDFSILFLINLLMVVVLSLFAYALAAKESKLTERTREVASSEQKSAAKTRYLASMSHEIRTPMQGIIGLTQILSQSELDDNQRRNLGLIATSATTLLGILNDILDIAKIEAEKMELAPAPIELRKTVEEVVQLSSSIAKEKDVDLEFSFSPHLPDRILADGTRMKQVLLNLSSNAIKFCAGQADGRRGSVRIRFEAREPGRIYFEIADNGIGITPEVLGRLFTPYTQASSDTSKRFGGTGLGLTITKQIVDLMSGSIHVESQPGVGSTFSVDIPVKEITAQSDKVDLKGKTVLSLLTERSVTVNIAGHISAAGGIYREERDFDRVIDQLFANETPPSVLIPLPVAQDLSDQLRRIQATFPNVHFLILSDVIVPSNSFPENCSVVDCNPLLPSVLLEEIKAGLRPKMVQAKPEPSITAAPDPAPSKGRILVAEDNQINQMVLRTQLNKMGYDVDIVDDGQQALAKVADSAPYDVILSDCNMPVMNGLDFARALRKSKDKPHLSQTPIIALTADAFEQQRIECMDAGMDDFLVKPTSVEQLSEKLEFWLRKSVPKTPPSNQLLN
ncbi:MAG: response regulator [Thalassovita sp.]